MLIQNVVSAHLINERPFLKARTDRGKGIKNALPCDDDTTRETE